MKHFDETYIADSGYTAHVEDWIDSRGGGGPLYLAVDGGRGWAGFPISTKDARSIAALLIRAADAIDHAAEDAQQESNPRALLDGLPEPT